MRSRISVLLALSLLLSLALCGCSTQTDGPQSVKIAMGFVPNVQFTPVYVALERGYFEDEGLYVELDYGMETDLLQRVGTNDLQFAIGSGDQVVLARANDLPVKYVFNWYRRFPVCVASLAKKGMTSPADLVGKTVGIPVTEGASYIGWQAFLSHAGILPEQVDLQVVGYTQVASLTEGRIDAAVCYAMNEPVQLATAGHAVNTFYLDDYTHLVSNGLITNDKTIKKQPELVQAVVRAMARGLQDTLDDPDAAFDIARAAIPEMDDTTAALQYAVLQECLVFWEADDLGASRPSDWQESVELLHELGMTQQRVAVGDVYTNEFVTNLGR